MGGTAAFHQRLVEIEESGAAQPPFTSRMIASPWPPPEQIAETPRPPPRRRRSCTSDPRMRAPEAPIGWPSAMAPPFTFTFDSSTPSMRIELSATEANASLISKRSMSSTDSPAFSRAAFVAFAGVRARYGKSSATAAWATIVASAGRPLELAHSSDASTSAPAPSFTPGALPAVCAPSLWNAPRSFDRDRKSTRLNSSHLGISYAVFCLKKKKKKTNTLLHYHNNKNKTNKQ